MRSSLRASKSIALLVLAQTGRAIESLREQCRNMDESCRIDYSVTITKGKLGAESRALR